MRVMMLNANLLNACLFCVPRCRVIGMQIMCDDFRIHAEDVGKMTDLLLEGRICFGVFHVTDMMTEKSMMITGEAECVLELTAYGESGTNIKWQLDRVRSIPTRTA